jgi:hypothetical protein
LIKKYPINPLYLCYENESQLDEEYECSICYEQTKIINSVILNCNHKFCGICINNTLTLHNNIYNDPSCALCRQPISTIVIKNPEIYNNISPFCN